MINSAHIYMAPNQQAARVRALNQARQDRQARYSRLNWRSVSRYDVKLALKYLSIIGASFVIGAWLIGY